MLSNTLDITSLFDDYAKQILADSLLLAAKENYSQSTPYHLIKLLLKIDQVKDLLSQLGLDEKLFVNVGDDKSLTKTKFVKRVSFSVELKKLFLRPMKKVCFLTGRRFPNLIYSWPPPLFYRLQLIWKKPAN